jgi:hypothetical protein
LVARFGSTTAAAIAAMQRPEYAEEFRNIGAQLMELPNGELAFSLAARELEPDFWKVVVAALAWDRLDEELEQRVEESVEPAVSGKGGVPEKRYPRDEVVRVLLARRAGSVSQRELARPEFPRKAVRRVIRLDEHGAFRLGPRGGLSWAGSNGEFRPAGKEVSLRALERALGLGSLDLP